MKIIVLSPHRDDAAFSVGLAIDAWLNAGHTVQVVNCFTQSDYAPYSDVGSLHPNDRTSFVSALRRREDMAWQKLANGRLQFRDLDLLDAPLRLNCRLDELATVDIRPGDRAVARIAGAVAKLTRGATPETTALAVPLSIGDHIDHRVTRRAALETLSGTHLPLAFYEDLPYAARIGEAATGNRAIEAELSLKPTYVSPASEDPSIGMGRKLRIAQCYDSQVDSEVVQSIAEFSLSYDGRERLWVNDFWLSSALHTSQTHEQR